MCSSEKYSPFHSADGVDRTPVRFLPVYRRKPLPVKRRVRSPLVRKTFFARVLPLSPARLAAFRRREGGCILRADEEKGKWKGRETALVVDRKLPGYAPKNYLSVAARMARKTLS
jgi:hypothetical protein